MPTNVEQVVNGVAPWQRGVTATDLAAHSPPSYQHQESARDSHCRLTSGSRPSAWRSPTHILQMMTSLTK